ncbi:MAG: S-layer homology domain-containing protein [Solibacillus sp.]
MQKFLMSLIGMVLVLSMAMPSSYIKAAQVFSDVPVKYSNYADIAYLLDKGIISADKKAYGVKDIVTREEVAVMVAKAVGLNGTQRAIKFKDVPKSNKNSGYIQSAVEAGIIKGYTDGTFKPTTKVTRGQMAAFIARAFDLPNGKKSFKDVKKGHTAYAMVSQLAAANITKGYEDGTFKPENNLTRAHISAFLARAMKYQEGLTSSNMKVHFLDVGQGDSIFIQAPNGKTMLIDASTKEYGDTVIAYLKAQNVKRLDYVVATHPDADHIGGLTAVMKAFEVGEFINSGKDHTTVTYESLLETVLAKNIRYTEPIAGDLIALDSALKVQVLAVDAKNTENNDASIVLKLTYNGVSFLLTGDVSSKIEQQLMQKYDVSATILKTGHHGSSTSSALSFLQKVKPQAIILSYGAGNSYGHPHKEVVENIKTIDAKSYATATGGNIVATTNGISYSIQAKGVLVPNVTPEKPKTPTGNVNAGIYVIPGAPTTFKNCTAMRAYYPSGVSASHPVYAAAHDRDKDGRACE